MRGRIAQYVKSHITETSEATLKTLVFVQEQQKVFEKFLVSNDRIGFAF